MKNKILAVILFIGLFAIFSNIKAQYSIVTVNKPFIAKNLAGTVTDQLGSKMPNVTVSRVRRGWKDEIQSTKTDDKGRFSFKNLPAGLYHLRFEAIGFNPLEVKVRLKKHSKAKLKFVIEIAT